MYVNKTVRSIAVKFMLNIDNMDIPLYAYINVFHEPSSMYR